MIALLALACSAPAAPGAAPPRDALRAGRTVASFERDVRPVLDARCLDSGCHAGAGATGLSLEGGDAWAAVVQVPSSQAPVFDLVEPGVPEMSYLLHKLRGTHLEVGGMGQRMPFGKDPLEDDEIARIEDWVRAGALP